MKTLRIVAPHFVAAVELNKYNEAYRAAPIIFYMANADWTEERIRTYCAQKGWRVEEIPS